MKEIIALVTTLFIIFLVLSISNNADNNRDVTNAAINELEVEAEKYTWTSYQNSDVTFAHMKNMSISEI